MTFLLSLSNPCYKIGSYLIHPTVAAWTTSSVMNPGAMVGFGSHIIVHPHLGGPIRGDQFPDLCLSTATPWICPVNRQPPRGFFCSFTDGSGGYSLLQPSDLKELECSVQGIAPGKTPAPAHLPTARTRPSSHSPCRPLPAPGKMSILLYKMGDNLASKRY